LVAVAAWAVELAPVAVGAAILAGVFLATKNRHRRDERPEDAVALEFGRHFELLLVVGVDRRWLRRATIGTFGSLVEARRSLV
jgi:hypothetical protein